MNLLILIILNGLLLYWFWIYTNNWFDWIWVMPVIYTCIDQNIICVTKSLIMWWFFLGLINFLIKPVLRIVWLPIFYLTIIILCVAFNLATILLFNTMMNTLEITSLGVNINWLLNLLFAVAIFTFFNTLYNILFIK